MEEKGIATKVIAIAVIFIAVAVALGFFFLMTIESPFKNPFDSESQKVPAGYYSTDEFPDYGGSFSDLEDFLTSGFKLPRDCQKGVFDCSESAAFAEWALEDAGFATSIAYSSHSPWGSEGHAWVIVSTTDGYDVAIETTALTGWAHWDKIENFFGGRIWGIVYGGDRDEYYYYHPEHRFLDIYEAVGYIGISEWDWWLGS